MAYYVTDSHGRIIASGGSAEALMEFEAPRLGFTPADIQFTAEEIVNTDSGRYLAGQCPASPPPGPEERRAEIMARLDALAELLPKQYTVINAMCGDAEARAIVAEKRAAHEAAAGPLRAELAGLAVEEVAAEVIAGLFPKEPEADAES